jgi:hypothetical protein
MAKKHGYSSSSSKIIESITGESPTSKQTKNLQALGRRVESQELSTFVSKDNFHKTHGVSYSPSLPSDSP